MFVFRFAIYSVESSLMSEYREKFLSEIESAVSDLRISMAGEDIDEIKTKLEESVLHFTNYKFLHIALLIFKPI